VTQLQSQVQTEQLRAENRILKKGIAVQANKVEKYEEEIRQLHTAGREAIQYIERLQNVSPLCAGTLDGVFSRVFV
jgi:uncharacterized protein YlxW (UPF0749 family)